MVFLFAQMRSHSAELEYGGFLNIREPMSLADYSVEREIDRLTEIARLEQELEQRRAAEARPALIIVFI